MNQSEQINELAGALAKAQGEYTPALKDSANPYFKSKYANLCSIVKACQEPLSKNGLSISQATNKDESSTWVLTTTLMHSSGQWLKSQTPIITIKNDIQSFGSASTYARRYAWASIAGVTTDEDDDGEVAMAREQSPAQKKYEQKKSSTQVVEQESLNVKPIYIGENEISIFNFEMKKCTEGFQNNIWKYLNTQGVYEFKDMNTEHYTKVMTMIKIKVEGAIKSE